MYPTDGPFLEAEYRRAFRVMAETGVDALFVSELNENWSHRELIIELAEKHRLPAMYSASWFVEGGGLMAYGQNPVEIGRADAELVAEVLKGGKPAEIPIRQRQKSN